MTKPTPLEAAIQRTRASLSEATAKANDIHAQILTLDRELYVARAHIGAYTDALKLMGADDTTEAAPEPATQRAKPGEIEAAVTTLLEKYPDGIKLEGLEERTGHKRSSIQAALRRMIDGGKIDLVGDLYRIQTASTGNAGSAPHISLPDREAAE